MRLRELAEAHEIDRAADPIEITGLTADSREVRPGMLFAALPGTRTDGAVFALEAIRAGAAAVLASPVARIEAPDGFPVIRAGDPRARFAFMAAAFHAPQPRIVVAVTGTNGKTSVASFTEQIWRRLGIGAGSIGTLGVSGAPDLGQVSLTSPDPVALHRALQGLGRAGVDHVALEASSHGLVQRRLEGVRLAGGAFTNISRDHLDYHDSFADYFAAKLRLFRDLLAPGSRAVVNLDGTGAETVLAAARENMLDVMTVGRDGETLKLVSSTPGVGQLAIEVEAGGRRRTLVIPLVGGFQAENALVAAALATADREVALDDALDCLAHLKGACGRLEKVAETPDGADIYVDYAHTPDALAAALKALRPHTAARLVVVFGAGGDRDTGKRALMGAAARDNADVVIVTDDNPRTEEPAAIRAQVLEGAPDATEIGDRGEAIGAAIGGLASGDVLLIAGKGHETGQIVGDRVLAFSDHEAVRIKLGGGAAA